MRKILAALTLSALLGCAGLAPTISGEEDSGLETGGAVHPEDFPLPPLRPDEGTLHQALTLSVAGTRTVTVIYELAPDVSDAALLARYRALLEEQGHEVSDTPHLGDPTIAADLSDDQRVSASIARGGGKRTLRLVLSVRGA